MSKPETANWPVDYTTEEDRRMAREAARDCYNAVLSLARYGGRQRFGVHHMNHRVIVLDIQVSEPGKPWQEP